MLQASGFKSRAFWEDRENCFAVERLTNEKRKGEGMIIEPKRIDPFEPAIDSTEFDAHHRDIAAQGYRHYANVADNREDSVVEAIEKAKRAGYHHVYAHGRAYDDKGVLIPGAVSIWVKRGCKDGCVA